MVYPLDHREQVVEERARAPDRERAHQPRGAKGDEFFDDPPGGAVRTLPLDGERSLYL